MKKEKKVPEQVFETKYHMRKDDRMSGSIYFGGKRVLTFNEQTWINKHFYDNISKKLNHENTNQEKSS